MKDNGQMKMVKWAASVTSSSALTAAIARLAVTVTDRKSSGSEVVREINTLSQGSTEIA